MATRILNVALRIALLTALVASLALFVDYGSSASLCGEGGGCAAVKSSAFARIGPVSLPTIGIGTFAGLFAMAIWASRLRHFKVLVMQTGVVALGAVTLISLMLFEIGAVCQWCLAVDLSAIVSFVLALVIYRRSKDELDEESVPLRMLWATAGLVALSVPLLWDYTAEANEVPVPKSVAKLQQPNKVNVIMFTDFQCPHCERLHDAMEEMRPTLGEQLNVVRMMYPLDFHPGAMPSALAYLCMPDHLRERAADAFYKAPNEELTPKGVIATAEEIGADPDEVAKCMADPKTNEKIEYDKQIFQNADLSGVPTTYVNGELIRGADLVAFKSALHRAQGGDGGGSDVIWMFVFIGLVVGGVACASIYRW